MGGREVRRKGRTGREGEKEEGWKKTRRMINMREGVGAGVMSVIKMLPQLKT